MKKAILVFFIAMLFSSSIFSQVRWGLYPGISAYKFSTNGPNDNISTNSSLHFGAFVEPHIVDHLYLETGLIYGNRGYKVNETLAEDISGEDWSYRGQYEMEHITKLPYFGIPVIANYYAIDKKFKLFASTGLKAGLYFDGTTETSSLSGWNSASGSVPKEVEIDHGFSTTDLPVGSDGMIKSFNFDAVIGGGFGVGRFTIAYRYNMGLLNGSNIEGFELKNQGHDISLKIDLSKR